MAAGVAEALRGKTIPINPPPLFTNPWADPVDFEAYFDSSFNGLWRDEASARAGILEKLQVAGGEGTHGIVYGDRIGAGQGHLFNVILEGGALKVIDVSQTGTGFAGLTSFQFMLVK
jgi:hypothetical protein